MAYQREQEDRVDELLGELKKVLLSDSFVELNVHMKGSKKEVEGSLNDPSTLTPWKQYEPGGTVEVIITVKRKK